MMNSPQPPDAAAQRAAGAPDPAGAPRGRRAGKPDTRAQILAVARERFLREGYASVTLRSIATEAGCDVALISYHFGSKRGLLAFVTTWDSPEFGGRLRELMRGVAADPALGDLVRGGMQTEMIDKIAARLGGADARTRAGMFNSQMSGVMFTRYLLRLEPIASMTVDEIVRALAPALTVTLRGLPGRPRAPHGTR